MAKKNYKVTTNMPVIPKDNRDPILSLFDQDNPDINLFNLIDDEIIKISGSEFLYYKYYRSEEDWDDVYMEDRNKTITSQAITVHGHYEPKALEKPLSEFGIELTNDQIFIFNKSYISQELHRDPIEHDVIKPLFQSQRYEITEVQEDSFEIYGVYHITCTARLMRDTRDQIEDHMDSVKQIGRDISE